MTAVPEDAPELLKRIAAHVSGTHLLIVVARLGLTTGKPMTLQQCATELLSGRSRERARQIERDAIRKLPGDLAAEVSALAGLNPETIANKKAKAAASAKTALRDSLRKRFSDNPPDVINYAALADEYGFEMDLPREEAESLPEIDVCRKLYERFHIVWFGKYAKCCLKKCDVKPLSEFLPGLKKQGPKGSRMCRACNVARTKAYYHKNSKRISQRGYELSKAKGHIYTKRYLKKHPEKRRAAAKRSYENWLARSTPEQRAERNRRKYQARKAKALAAQSAP